MEDKNDEIKKRENQNNDNYIIEENISLKFEGKKEKKMPTKTKNKKLTNKIPIITKKVKTKEIENERKVNYLKTLKVD